MLHTALPGSLRLGSQATQIKENMKINMKKIIGILLILPFPVIMVGGIVLLLIDGGFLLEGLGFFLLVFMMVVGAAILDITK